MRACRSSVPLRQASVSVAPRSAGADLALTGLRFNPALVSAFGLALTATFCGWVFGCFVVVLAAGFVCFFAGTVSALHATVVKASVSAQASHVTRDLTGMSCV